MDLIRKLFSETEPVRRGGAKIVAALAAIYATIGALNGVVDWSWLPVASIIVAGLATVATVMTGAEKSRSEVYPEEHVQQMMDSLGLPRVTLDEVSETAEGLVEEFGDMDLDVDLDEAARLAGLD